MPPCHRHMVIATNLSSLFDLLLCSTPQMRAECCLEFTAVSGYRMLLGPFGSAFGVCVGEGGGGIPCLTDVNSTNAGARNPVPFPNNERTNSVWFPQTDHEQQWTAAVLSRWALVPTSTGTR